MYYSNHYCREANRGPKVKYAIQLAIPQDALSPCRLPRNLSIFKVKASYHARTVRRGILSSFAPAQCSFAECHVWRSMLTARVSYER